MPDLTSLILAVVILVLIFSKRSIPMPQNVKINVTFNVKPAPLAVDQAAVTLPDEQVGQVLDKVPVAKVSGGTKPFLQPVVDPSSPNPLPAGVSAAIDEDGNVTVSGSPSAEGSSSVVLSVADSGA